MAETEPSVDDLAQRQDRIENKLDELLASLKAGGSTQAKAEEHQEEKLGRPSTIAEQVQMELDARDKAKADKAEKDAEKTERESIKERLAKLTETPPARPQPRRQRVMWGPS
jgi:chromosome segregation ATPase